MIINSVHQVSPVFTPELIHRFNSLPTPFYYYDLQLLKKTTEKLMSSAEKFGYKVHYAVKANSNEEILKIISLSGAGADCVSGNEIRHSLNMGFPPDKIVFAGVGKTDDEIRYAVSSGIFCFNCESYQEMEVINSIAGEMNTKARIAIRINPNVDAYTHEYITTGKEDNKFGIPFTTLSGLPDILKKMEWLIPSGVHFHIGSQITDPTVFIDKCNSINDILNHLSLTGFNPDFINAGGGLGINYENPDENSIPDFDSYFSIFNKHLHLKPGQQLHFEPGRSVVGQCGSLISRVLYVKPCVDSVILILDAGMTELIRPAFYKAYHKIENISRNTSPNIKYDVAGPVCESSDYFGKKVMLPESFRGDLIAIRSTGAYGETMSSRYNLRPPVNSVYST